MSVHNIDIEEGVELDLQFEKRGGLLPAVVQETATGQILMVASVNREAFQKTLRVGKATFWSTSRKELWTKGETSGNSMLVDDILVDCDQDAIVYQVTLEKGGVCHTFNKSGESRKSCFYRKLSDAQDEMEFIEE